MGFSKNIIRRTLSSRRRPIVFQSRIRYSKSYLNRALVAMHCFVTHRVLQFYCSCIVVSPGRSIHFWRTSRSRSEPYRFYIAVTITEVVNLLSHQTSRVHVRGCRRAPATTWWWSSLGSRQFGYLNYTVMFAPRWW